MKEIALIVSLNFRAAHISHLVASYKQLTELGFEPYCLVHPNALSFLPPDVRAVTSLKGFKKITISIFWFPSIKNIKMMIDLKLFHKSKIIYVFHEPIESFSSYIKSGNSKLWTIKFYLKYYVGLLFLRLSDKILLPSKKALSLYERGITKKINKDYHYMPLMYSDERSEEDKNTKRTYISYIGGISKDHAFKEFTDYIFYLKNKNPDFKFLIASWCDVPIDKKISELVDSGKLTIVSGHPMTNEEINRHYASSFFIWNAYNRSTQSGVLAKSFMFGTPAIVMKKNISEFVKDGREVVAVDDNQDMEKLYRATLELIRYNEEYSNNARKNYLRNYDYSIHNDSMRNLLDDLLYQ